MKTKVLPWNQRVLNWDPVWILLALFALITAGAVGYAGYQYAYAPHVEKADSRAPALSETDATTKTHAQVILRVHHPVASIAPPAVAIAEWAREVEAASQGRIRVELYDRNMLGGKGPELVGQVETGTVDMAWTVLGWTPTKFPVASTFELPFLTGNVEQGSRAFWQFMTTYGQDELASFKVIALHVAGPGIIHSRIPIRRMEDMIGKRVRAGNPIMERVIKSMGAVPVTIPSPMIPETLAAGGLDAVTISWNVAVQFGIVNMTSSHTMFSGPESWYTQTFAFLMNRAAYARLEPDLRAIIDAYSGPAWSAKFARYMAIGDMKDLAVAKAVGNKIIVLDPAETARWKAKSQMVVPEWAASMKAFGKDGNLLYVAAQRMVKGVSP